MTRNKEEIMEEFLQLACALSPENLTCDGEASQKDIQANLKSIKKAWNELEEEIGYPVTEDDTWTWHRNQMKSSYRKN